MIFVNQVVRTRHQIQQSGCHQHIDCRHVPTVGGAVAGGAIAGGAIAGYILNTHSWGTNNRMKSLIIIINNKRIYII